MGAVVAGCLVPWFGPLVALVAVLVGVGLAGLGSPLHRRRRVVTSIAVSVFAVAVVGWWAQRAKDGLSVPSESFERTEAIVRSDPKPTLGGDAVELSVGGHRWQATIPAGSRGGDLHVGDVVVVSGSTAPFASSSAFRQSRHLVGRFRIRRVESVRSGAIPFRWANTIRAALLRSAADFPPTLRTLFAGFVLGDVRTARPELTDDFRASGLSHLVVVSGQNLAFLLAGVQPIVRLVARRWSSAAVVLQLTVVFGFVFVARFEPSVLRAAAMASLVLISRGVGRPQPLIRIVLVASALLVLIDPLLVRSVGFALSVGAVGGIAVFEPPLRERLRRFGRLGPPLAVTLAAQIGTAPCLLLVFDGIPVVSFAANLVALPLAAPIMGWGVVAGLPAGFLGSTVSSLVHVPTRLLLGAIAGVARWSAKMPLGSITIIDAVLIAAAALAWTTARQTLVRSSHVVAPERAQTRPFSRLALVAALLVPTARAMFPAATGDAPPFTGEFGPAVRWWASDGSSLVRHADVVVIAHGASASRMLQAVRTNRIGSVDLVVVASGGKPQTALVRALVHRVDVGVVISAPGVGAVSGTAWRRAEAGLVLEAGSTIVRVLGVKGRMVSVEVVARPRPP